MEEDIGQRRGHGRRYRVEERSCKKYKLQRNLICFQKKSIHNYGIGNLISYHHRSASDFYVLLSVAGLMYLSSLSISIHLFIYFCYLSIQLPFISPLLYMICTQGHGSQLLVLRGCPSEVLPRVAKLWEVDTIAYESDTEVGLCNCIYAFFYQSIHLPIHPSIYLSIYLSILYLLP